MTTKEINNFLSIQSRYSDYRFQIERRLEERLGDTVLILEIEDDLVRYRTGVTCRCGSGSCWYKYGKAKIRDIFSENNIPLEEFEE
jgi:hypothetical protein